jgi:osmotically-inducible protein OsmY
MNVDLHVEQRGCDRPELSPSHGHLNPHSGNPGARCDRRVSGLFGEGPAVLRALARHSPWAHRPGSCTHRYDPSRATDEQRGLPENFTMTDNELKTHVQSALDWEPSVDPSDIGVSVDDGVVTLRGNVASYAERMAAERAVLHVYGVKAVANDLAVHLGSLFERTDTEIARAAVAALKWNALIPKDKITVTVASGWLTLTGAVDWQYQRDAAFRAVRDLTGVKGVTNSVTVKSHVKSTDVRDKIEAAFKRSAEIDARRVNVTALNGKVILSGNVHSWFERQEAERAAWAAPGVTQVEDRLTITP